MSRHEDSVTLRQMLEHIEEAVSLACGRTREQLDSDRMFYLAVLKLVEIVGEAAGRLSSSFQTSHPEIPWRQIVGARNRLVHGYDAVDRDVLWEIVTADFPALALALKPLL
jgi:uncharacterized protein with HEPN domain